MTLAGPRLDGLATAITGVRADGSAYAATLPRLGATEADDETPPDDAPALGRADADGWWCKAVLQDDAALLLSRGDGRKVEYRLRRASGDGPPP